MHKLDHDGSAQSQSAQHPMSNVLKTYGKSKTKFHSVKNQNLWLIPVSAVSYVIFIPLADVLLHV